MYQHIRPGRTYRRHQHTHPPPALCRGPLSDAMSHIQSSLRPGLGRSPLRGAPHRPEGPHYASSPGTLAAARQQFPGQTEDQDHLHLAVNDHLLCRSALYSVACVRPLCAAVGLRQCGPHCTTAPQGDYTCCFMIPSLLLSSLVFSCHVFSIVTFFLPYLLIPYLLIPHLLIPFFLSLFFSSLLFYSFIFAHFFLSNLLLLLSIIFLFKLFLRSSLLFCSLFCSIFSSSPLMFFFSLLFYSTN